jgi:hypothetical protein
MLVWFSVTNKQELTVSIVVHLQKCRVHVNYLIVLLHRLRLERQTLMLEPNTYYNYPPRPHRTIHLNYQLHQNLLGRCKSSLSQGDRH